MLMDPIIHRLLRYHYLRIFSLLKLGMLGVPMPILSAIAHERRLAERAPGRVKMHVFVVWVALLFVVPVAVSPAQQTPPPQPTPTPPAAEQTNTAQEETILKPRRPSVSRPAEFQGSGVLQLEYGYDGSFRSKDLQAAQTGSLTLSFAVSQRLQLEFDLDTVTSQTDRAGTQVTGIGDAHVGFQVTMFRDTKRHPSLAFAYLVKLPWASEVEGLGSGRVDHKIIGLTSEKVGATDLDFNLALLVNGRERKGGFSTGGQFALGLTYGLPRGFGIQGELSGQSLDTDQPQGIFALGALTYQANPRVIFDVGMRFGLNPNAPRIGVFAGVTFGVASFYKKRK